jgi:hypothetical protein
MNYEFEIGDPVVYNPNVFPLPLLKERPYDLGTVIEVSDPYLKVYFKHGDYVSTILRCGLTHHPESPKVIRGNMSKVLPHIVASVEARVAALVFSERTGMTAQRGFGPADILRSYLEPAERGRKHIYIKA